MRKQISAERKTAYYIGSGISVLGLVLFLSVFVTSALNFGDFDNFQGRARSSMLRGVFGMILLIVGQVVRGVGARGLSGSGVVLDPEQAREDLHPYSNAAGGMIGDALEAAGMDVGREQQTPAGPAILIRCSDCRKLNEETDKFCGECGASLQ